MPFVLEPWVAGELGPNTALDSTTHPPSVKSVEYLLDSPVEADLIESFPVFLVSEDLGRQLIATDLRGFSLVEANVAPSREYLAVYGQRPHKRYKWMRLQASPSPDAWEAADGRLCVSDRMMGVLEGANLEGCDIAGLDE